MNLGDARVMHAHAQTHPGRGAIGALAWSAAVVPLGARDSEALAELGGVMGTGLTQQALSALGVGADQVTSYGKGAIVGGRCSLESAAQCIHPQMGKAMRAALGRGSAIVPSTVKRAGAGARLDVPLHGLEDAWTFANIASTEVFVPGAPADDEIVLVVALGVGPFSDLAA